LFSKQNKNKEKAKNRSFVSNRNLSFRERILYSFIYTTKMITAIPLSKQKLKKKKQLVKEKFKNQKQSPKKKTGS